MLLDCTCFVHQKISKVWRPWEIELLMLQIYLHATSVVRITVELLHYERGYDRNKKNDAVPVQVYEGEKYRLVDAGCLRQGYYNSTAH